MSKALLVLFTAFPFILFAQDYDEHITADSMQKIANDSGDYAFHRLLPSFQNIENLLNEYELLMLQIGFTNQPQFSPNAKVTTPEIKDLEMKKKWAKALELLKKQLLIYPVSMDLYMEQGFLLESLKDSIGSSQSYKKASLLLEALINSGTGDKPQEAYIITSENDENNILRELKLVPKEKVLIEYKGKTYHKITCREPRTYAEKVVFFDYNIPFNWGLKKH